MTTGYPVIALRMQVILPNAVENIDVGRSRSKVALEEAQANDSEVILVTQRDPSVSDPGPNDLYTTGTIAVIKQILRLPNETLQVLIETRRRVRVTNFHEGNALYAEVEMIDEQAASLDQPATVALMTEAKSTFVDYQRRNKRLRIDSLHLESIKNSGDPGLLADLITRHAHWDVEQKQRVLETANHVERLEIVIERLRGDIERYETDQAINQRVKKRMDTNQREYYLREQMKAIQEELGSGELGEADEYRERIAEKELPEAVETRALKEVDRLEKIPSGSPEGTVVRSYLDTILELPWTEADEEHLDISHTEQVLNADHYALEEPKDRILEFLAVRQLVRDKSDANYTAPILCLVGPPGVGKTSLGKSIAESLNRKFVRMSLGGVRDEAEIRGHRRTYIGSLPGRIIQGMRTAGTVNPVFLLDEIDKMTSDFRGDPSSALLEVLDPEQNSTFADHYLEIPYDLSQVMFITTANSLATIPRPLLDRMEVIQIPGYTLHEKLEIARRYRVPKQLRDHGLTESLHITNEALTTIITSYTREAGVRNLDREIAKVARKMARQYLEQPWSGVKDVTDESVRDLLGVPPFRDDAAEKEPQIGVSHGLAWTSIGGVTLDIEAVSLPGTGKLTLTGRLGDVMKESAQAAIAFLRKNAEEYGIDTDIHETRDLHIHVLEGATPKDGPSAGIAIATAAVSALTERPVRGDVAMTGEISLRGRVLPIGGVKEKLLAAHQAGIRTVILPKENEANLEDLPDTIRDDLSVVLVEEFAEVLNEVLIGDDLPGAVIAARALREHGEQPPLT